MPRVATGERSASSLGPDPPPRQSLGVGALPSVLDEHSHLSASIERNQQSIIIIELIKIEGVAKSIMLPTYPS